MPSTPSYITDVLPEPAWREAAEAHERRVRVRLEGYLEDRSRGRKHPVMDFLFEYYRFRPARLMRWSPGFGVALEGPSADDFLDLPGFKRTPCGVALDPDSFPEHRKRSVRWIRDVLKGTEERPPFLGCHGMHEWAMVYRTDQVRHDQVPLRLPPDAIAAVVESRPIACTHYDAFRFFTPEARPLNVFQPTHGTMPVLEQPGCLHTNMDLYRWAYKFYPWIPSNLIADAFELACRIREVDMRASPYDLRAYGLEPIRVETAEGRRRYQAFQQQFMHDGMPIRRRLLAVYDRLLEHL